MNFYLETQCCLWLWWQIQCCQFKLDAYLWLNPILGFKQIRENIICQSLPEVVMGACFGCPEWHLMALLNCKRQRPAV